MRYHYTEFQFLIGIMNLYSSPIVSVGQFSVSIPHRYYESILADVLFSFNSEVSIPHRYYESVDEL